MQKMQSYKPSIIENYGNFANRRTTKTSEVDNARPPYDSGKQDKSLLKISIHGVIASLSRCTSQSKLNIQPSNKE